MSTNTPTTDTRPLSERLKSAHPAPLLIELARRVEALERNTLESNLLMCKKQNAIADTTSKLADDIGAIREALEARPAQAEAAPTDVPTRADVAEAHALLSSYGVSRTSCGMDLTLGARIKALHEGMDREAKCQSSNVNGLQKHLAEARAQLATARQEGAEAERKRIVQYCEDAVKNWQKSMGANARAGCLCVYCLLGVLAEHLRKEGGAS
jgi:hypothetical protein